MNQFATITPTVTLTWPEMLMAANVGMMRHVHALKAGRADCHGAERGANGWSLHIEGAAAEMAVAKHFGVYWNGTIGEIDADDVGPMQVRATSQQAGRLILREKDPDNRAFILLTGLAPSFVIRGWIMARDGKQEQWRMAVSSRPPAYFVPQDALRPISELHV